MSDESNQNLETLSGRLKWIRTKRGISQGELARSTNLTQGAIQQIEANPAAGTKYIGKISRALNCNPHWLETGKGNINEGSTLVVLVPVVPLSETMNWKLGIKNYDKYTENIPMLESNADDFYAVEVPNDFMQSPDKQEPTFNQGEIVIINEKLPVKNGNFVVANHIIDNVPYPIFRKYVEEGKKKYLVTFAAGIPPIEIDENVIICGPAIEKRVFVRY